MVSLIGGSGIIIASASVMNTEAVVTGQDTRRATEPNKEDEPGAKRRSHRP